MEIRPARRVNGTIHPPGDKSISHRAALIAALAKDPSYIKNYSTSLDCASTLSCLSELGVSIERDGSNLKIDGVGETGLMRPTRPLDCGNSGSSLRMLAGILAGQSFDSTLTGDGSLRSRPMKRVIEPLKLMGASIASENGRPPLKIAGVNGLKAIRYEMPIASAQVKSCLLLAGLLAEGTTEVLESAGTTRDHTERMLKWFGVTAETLQAGSVSGFCVNGPAKFCGREVNIPGDFSSSAFFIAAAALLPESELEVESVGLNPTRTRFLKVVRQLGVQIEEEQVREDSNEPRGLIRVRGKEMAGPHGGGMPLTVKGKLPAELIDELPLIAIIGTQVPGGLVVRDAAELRTKESDRIAVTVQNLRAMGARIEEYQDGFAVQGKVQLRGARVETHGDHRIAMAFSVAALIAEGETEIRGDECVAISFPDFFSCLESVVER
jgi:3-phosphoshikimate 1-carboxyvinyltransferase